MDKLSMVNTEVQIQRSTTGSAPAISDACRIELLSTIREARATLLNDAEAFHDASRVLEVIGQVLHNDVGDGLEAYRNVLVTLLVDSGDIIEEDADVLFETIRLARNDVVHGGDYVRHISDRLVEFLILVEGSLMSRLLQLKDIMVRDVSVAAQWHSIAHVRRVMLNNAYSYLPLESSSGKWVLCPVYSIVRCLAKAKNKNERKNIMKMTIKEFVKNDELFIDPKIRSGSDLVAELLNEIDEVPTLIIEKENSNLIGIVTSFDLLAYSQAKSVYMNA